VPFISKAIGIPVAKIAARIMVGEKLKKFNLEKRISNNFAIKEAVFPFNKFPYVDVLLGPEMKSTGEVMGIDENFGLSFAKSQMACGNELPVSGTAFISVKDKDKKNALNFAKKLKELNFKLCATSGTAKYLNSNGINCKKINKVREGSPHIVESLNEKNIELVINTAEGIKSVSDSYSLRRSALVNKIPYCTSLAAANACIQAIDSLKNYEIKVKAIQEL
jgi:carbamoyl-phosphate synthase large subunit